MGRLRQTYFRTANKLLKITPDTLYLPLDYKGQAAGNLIRNCIESDVPCMITRIGAIELETIVRTQNTQAKGGFWRRFYRYLFKGSGPFWWDDGIRRRMSTNTGFFPVDDEHLMRFAELMLEDFPLIDVLGTWLQEMPLNNILGSWLAGVDVRMKPYFPEAKIVPLQDLEPYYHSDPWSQVLKGKKVLVIHPFETSIRNQYSQRQYLFRNPGVLPEFNLLTLKAVQSIAGNPVEFTSWFDALDRMCVQVERMDFDVAIIGAGAYGLPLAAFVKRMGKKAIHLGGATQILFGIRGLRWDQWEFFQQLYNEYWVRPLPEEIPVKYQSVEGGCYW